MTNQAHLEPEPQDALSQRLTRALETAPSFTLPANFAVRTAMAAAALPLPTVAKPRASITTLAIRAGFAVLAVAMLAIAAWSRGAQSTQQEVLLGTEIALAIEFVALTTWLSLRPPSAR